MTTINEAKRLIAASSIEGARLLGAGVAKPCYSGRYNIAAQAALADPDAGLTPSERSLIASFIEGEGGETRDDRLQIRVSQAERVRLEQLAEEAGLNVSEYVRQRALEWEER